MADKTVEASAAAPRPAAHVSYVGQASGGKYKETFIYALRGRHGPVIGSALPPDIHAP
jgi:hypothetical protein